MTRQEYLLLKEASDYRLTLSRKETGHMLGFRANQNRSVNRKQSPTKLSGSFRASSHPHRFCLLLRGGTSGRAAAINEHQQKIIGLLQSKSKTPVQELRRPWYHLSFTVMVHHDKLANTCEPSLNMRGGDGVYRPQLHLKIHRDGMIL